MSNTSETVASSEAFYDQLQSVISDVPPKDMLVVLDDFNACVGSDSESWKSVISPHGIGVCNGNGQRLQDFCSNNQLLITNTKVGPTHQHS